MTDPGGDHGLIVIGGGLAGLSTAACWARHRPDEPVVVLEQQPHVGGYVTRYRRKGWRFDLPQMMPAVDEVLDHLGVELPLHRFEGTLARVALAGDDGGLRRVLDVPADRAAFGAWLVDEFPTHADGLRRFLADSRAMFDELRGLKREPGWLDILGMLWRCRRVVRHAGHTFARYRDRFGLDDADLREVLDLFVEFGALPAERVAALVPVSAMHSLLDGAYRPADGWDALPAALRQRLEALGGTVRTGARVRRIHAERGRVAGVELEDGERLRAPRVVTTIDPRAAMLELVGDDALGALDPGYLARVRDVEMTPSSFNVHLGLDDAYPLAAKGLAPAYNVVSAAPGSFARLFDDDGGRGALQTPLRIGVACPTLAVGGAPYVTLRVYPVPIGDWPALRDSDRDAYRQRRARWAERFVELAQRTVLPGIREHVRFVDLATPATYARYGGSPTGSIYDMAPVPENFGRTRLPMRTPVRGLLQPKFVHGIFGALYGGLQAVDTLLDGAVMGGLTRLPG